MSTQYKPGAFALSDAAVCSKCGARFGRCEHTSDMVPARAQSESNPHRRRLWTDAEDDLLIDMYWLDGISTKTISQRLTRTTASVGNRIQWIKRHKLGRIWL